jgi:hypothetical protein
MGTHEGFEMYILQMTNAIIIELLLGVQKRFIMVFSRVINILLTDRSKKIRPKARMHNNKHHIFNHNEQMMALSTNSISTYENVRI